MALKRQFAGLIWAAVLVIAAQLVASVALAHAGHSHAPAAVATPSSDEIAQQASVGEAEHPSASVEISAADDGSIDPVGAPAGACNGSCCGNGVSCCGSALLPATADGPPFTCKALAPTGLGDHARSGIDPEALPEPPKSFA